MKKKLTALFKELRSIGYFARQNFWCCQTCAWSAIPEEKANNAIFYHNQDNPDIKEFGQVYIGWAGDGNKIKELAEKHGLTVEWDGSEFTRIKLIDPEFA